MGTDSPRKVADWFRSRSCGVLRRCTGALSRKASQQCAAGAGRGRRRGPMAGVTEAGVLAASSPDERSSSECKEIDRN
jgi:hypothetical protein